MKLFVSRISLALFAGLLAPTCLTAAAPAPSPASDTSVPGDWQAENFVPVAHMRLPQLAFKLTLASAEGRTYLYVGGPGGNNPGAESSIFEGFAVIDVTDAVHPRLVRQVPVKYSSGQLTTDGRYLIAGQVLLGDRRKLHKTGEPSEFFTLFDLKDPANPVAVSTFSATGIGTHRNTYAGGRYVYLSSDIDGYHHNILQIVDISNPKKPREVSKFWLPGQAPGETVPEGPIGFHGPLALSKDHKTATMGYAPSLINLDLSDVAHPKLIGQANFGPSDSDSMTYMHTGQPLFGDYVHVNTEPHGDGCKGRSLNFSAIIDNKDPAHPLLAAYYPRPTPPPGSDFKSFCELNQWFGMHNINQEGHDSASRLAGKLVFASYFVAGLRAYSLEDPFFPREVGYFMPKNTGRQRGTADDVAADNRGYVYVSDTFGQEIWVLRYIGPDPDKTN